MDNFRSIDIEIDLVILENIDIEMDVCENFDINVDFFFENINIDIDKTLYKLEFGLGHIAGQATTQNSKPKHRKMQRKITEKYKKFCWKSYCRKLHLGS